MKLDEMSMDDLIDMARTIKIGLSPLEKEIIEEICSRIERIQELCETIFTQND